MILVKQSCLWGALLCFWPTAVILAAVDINHADADAIAEALHGVGKAKAIAIVRDREANGPFSSIDDLKRIKGIKDAVVEHNRDIMTLGNSPTSSPSASAAAKK